MTPARRETYGPALVVAVFLIAGLCASAFLVAPSLSVPSDVDYDPTRLVLYYSTLPRLATAILVGAALALAGALFQQVLRNPLADPTTLGVSAGANLALVLASLFLPGLLGANRDLVALAGSGIAAVAIVCGLITRPLSILDLGDNSSSALGVRAGRLRFIAIACAVALAAFVTSAVGVISFIGLVAPTLSRLAGARRPGQLIFWSPLIGASLLFCTDAVLQLVAGGLGDFLPTGAVTAIFGSPLLLALLPRLKIRHRIQQSSAWNRPRPFGVTTSITVAAVSLCLILAISILVGRSIDGSLSILQCDLASELLAIRVPKVLAALAAGAMLAVAGSILQRLTGNEMSSPEVLGISAGATFGVAIGLFAVAPGLFGQFTFAIAGAIAVLAVIFLSSRRSGFSPERVLLAGIALSAMVDAVVGVLSSTGDPRAALLMRWMSGSTYLVDSSSALAEVGIGAVLISIAFATRRWLDILPLGPSPSSAVGISLARSRFVLFALAGLMTGAATLTVGPLSFVGLMGPHLAREAGLARALPQMIGAAFIGGALMVAADFLGRTLVSPYQIPAGLVSAMIGAPFLMFMMRKKA